MYSINIILLRVGKYGSGYPIKPIREHRSRESDDKRLKNIFQFPVWFNKLILARYYSFLLCVYYIGIHRYLHRRSCFRYRGDDARDLSNYRDIDYIDIIRSDNGISTDWMRCRLKKMLSHIITGCFERVR